MAGWCWESRDRALAVYVRTVKTSHTACNIQSYVRSVIRHHAIAVASKLLKCKLLFYKNALYNTGFCGCSFFSVSLFVSHFYILDRLSAAVYSFILFRTTTIDCYILHFNKVVVYKGIKLVRLSFYLFLSLSLSLSLFLSFFRFRSNFHFCVRRNRSGSNHSSDLRARTK